MDWFSFVMGWLAFPVSVIVVCKVANMIPGVKCAAALWESRETKGW